MTDCPRIGKLFGGCKFKPRYEEMLPSADQLDALACFEAAEILATRSKTYIRDVCETCGKTVERST